MFRDLVRSVISDAGAGGERDKFFEEIRALVDTTFGEMDEEIRVAARGDDEWKAKALRRGMTHLGDPREEQSIIESVMEGEETCLTLTKLYLPAIQAFAHKQVTNPTLLPLLQYDALGTFIAKLYRCLSNNPDTLETYFRDATPASERDALLSREIHNAMMKSTRWPRGKTPHTTPPITPHDSVSNIVHRAAVPSVVGTRMGQSVASKVVSVVKGGQGSAFSAFRAPSVVAEPRRSSVVAEPRRTSVVAEPRRSSVVAEPRSRAPSTTKHIKVEVTPGDKTSAVSSLSSANSDA